MVTGFYLFERDILFCSIRIPASRAATARSAAAALVSRGGKICRHNMVLPVLLLPRSGLCAVGDFLRAIGLRLHGVLLYLGKLAAVGGVVVRRPVPHFMLDCLLPISG